MTAPVLAVGDGALGFWGALSEVFPETAHQTVLGPQDGERHERPAQVGPTCRPCGRSPRSETPRTRPRREGARSRSSRSTRRSGPRPPRRSTKDREELLAFYAFPAEHWVHLKTTNPIESTFATVRLRTKVTKGPGSRAAGLAMAYKLIESAQTRWRARQRTAPRRAGSCRCEVREGGDGRANRRAGRGGRRVVGQILIHRS